MIDVSIFLDDHQDIALFNDIPVLTTHSDSKYQLFHMAVQDPELRDTEYGFCYNKEDRSIHRLGCDSYIRLLLKINTIEYQEKSKLEEFPWVK